MTCALVFSLIALKCLPAMPIRRPQWRSSASSHSHESLSPALSTAAHSTARCVKQYSHEQPALKLRLGNKLIVQVNECALCVLVGLQVLQQQSVHLADGRHALVFVAGDEDHLTPRRSVTMTRLATRVRDERKTEKDRTEQEVQYYYINSNKNGI